MKYFRRWVASLLVFAILLTVCFLPVVAADAQVCIGDAVCTTDNAGTGWTLTVEGDNFTLSLDNYHGLAMYDKGCIAAQNCTLQIVLAGDNEIYCGYAEHNAPYPIYGIYAENASVTVCGEGSLKLNTVRCPGALPLVLSGGLFSVESGSVDVLCAEFAFSFVPGTVYFSEGTTTLNGEAVDENGVPIVIVPCEHIDQAPMDGVCDLCGESVPYEPPVEPDHCPMAKCYEKHKNTLILNFFVVYLHRIVHELWLKKQNKSASSVAEICGRVLQDTVTLYMKGAEIG